jgi:YQGE family putative transporter
MEMSAEEKLLIKILGLYSTSSALASIFLSVFLFKLGGFSSVVQYGLISVIALYVIYVLSSWVLRKISAAGLMKLGTLAATIFYALLVLLRGNSINFLPLLGFFNGAAVACFWSGFNLSQYILTHEHTRHTFFGRQNFLVNIARIFGPLVSGAIVGLAGIWLTKTTGYTLVFLLVAIIMLYTYFETTRLPVHKGVEFSFSHILHHNRSREWKIVLYQQFLNGFYDSALGVVLTILIFVIVKQEFTLGVVNSIMGIVFSVSYVIAAQLLQKNKKSLVLAMIFPPLGILIFAFLQSWVGIAILVLSHYVFYPLMDITLMKGYFDSIDKEVGSWQNKYHFLVERETALNSARAVTYLILFLLVQTTNQFQVARTWLLVIPFLIITIGLLQFNKFRVASD